MSISDELIIAKVEYLSINVLNLQDLVQYVNVNIMYKILEILKIKKGRHTAAFFRFRL